MVSSRGAKLAVSMGCSCWVRPACAGDLKDRGRGKTAQSRRLPSASVRICLMETSRLLARCAAMAYDVWQPTKRMRIGRTMDSLITAAARARASGDPLGALNLTALRDDPPALGKRRHPRWGGGEEKRGGG